MSAAENDRPLDIHSLDSFSRGIVLEIATDPHAVEAMKLHLGGDPAGDAQFAEYIEAAYAPYYKDPGLSDRTVNIGRAECIARVIKSTMEEGQNGGQA